MIGTPSTAAAERGLQAHVDSLSMRFAERAADGSFCGRRGLYEHHARVLRQATDRLLRMESDGREQSG